MCHSLTCQGLQLKSENKDNTDGTSDGLSIYRNIVWEGEMVLGREGGRRKRKRKPVISSVCAKRREEIDCVWGGLAGFGSGKTETISSREQTDRTDRVS